MLLSGGLDSAACIYLLRRKYRLTALTFEYHGIARGELEAARAIARSTGVESHRVFRLPDLREANDIPGAGFAGMPPTYIPMRNSVFYSVAASCAEEVGADYIVGGHVREDQDTFVDARPEFFSRLQGSFWSGSEVLRARKLKILRPLARRTKVQVVRLAASLGVPFEDTWSCHRDGVRHCWACAGCSGRIEAFGRAGVADPLRK